MKNVSVRIVTFMSQGNYENDEPGTPEAWLLNYNLIGLHIELHSSPLSDLCPVCSNQNTIMYSNYCLSSYLLANH